MEGNDRLDKLEREVTELRNWLTRRADRNEKVLTSVAASVVVAFVWFFLVDKFVDQPPMWLTVGGVMVVSFFTATLITFRPLRATLLTLLKKRTH